MSNLGDVLAGRTWFRVLVTGSRTWTDQAAIFAALDGVLREHQMVTVVHGACREGADAIAREWVINSGHWEWVNASSHSRPGMVQAEPHPADWKTHGKAAGFIRNAEMVAAGADRCLAFILPCADPRCHRTQPHGSHGATHCADHADRAGIEVHRKWRQVAELEVPDQDTSRGGRVAPG